MYPNCETRKESLFIILQNKNQNLTLVLCYNISAIISVKILDCVMKTCMLSGVLWTVSWELVHSWLFNTSFVYIQACVHACMCVGLNNIVSGCCLTEVIACMRDIVWEISGIHTRKS